MARRRRRTRRTILLVVEGYTDKDFVQHLKDLYHRRECGFRVILKNAKGKGSNNVIDTAYGENRQGGYDDVVVFYDHDVPLTPKSKRHCSGFHSFVANPCLEGLLLEILEQTVAGTCEENKRRYAQFASRKRCQPWRAKRRLVVPSSREAALFSRRALRQRGSKVGIQTRCPVIGRQVRSSNELAKLLHSAW